MTSSADNNSTDNNSADKKADDKRLQSAHEWLVEAAAALDLDPKETTALTRELLDLTKDVAHNRSRPAAPLTAFLVGLASQDLEEAQANIDKLHAAIANGPQKERPRKERPRKERP